jgi:hypothetical protein
MTFTVKYRTNSGSITEKAVEAANREDCFAKCKAQGIAVVSVSNGKLKVNTPKKCGKFHLAGRNFNVKSFLIIGAVSVAIAVVAVFSNWNDGVPAQEQTEIAFKAKTVKKGIALMREKPATANMASDKRVSAMKQREKRIYLGSEVLRSEFITNGNIIIERVFTADGKRHRINHLPPSIFKHASDEYLAIFLSTPPGLPMAPFPDLSRDGGIEKAFLESLNEEIVIDSGDSDSVKEIKAKVIAARATMDAMMRQGMTFVKALENEISIHNENQSLKSQVNAEYIDLLKNANAEDAEDYRVRINKILSGLGIEEVQKRKSHVIKHQGENQ